MVKSIAVFSELDFSGCRQATIIDTDHLLRIKTLCLYVRVDMNRNQYFQTCIISPDKDSALDPLNVAQAGILRFVFRALAAAHQ